MTNVICALAIDQDNETTVIAVSESEEKLFEAVLDWAKPIWSAEEEYEPKTLNEINEVLGGQVEVFYRSSRMIT